MAVEKLTEKQLKKYNEGNCITEFCRRKRPKGCRRCHRCKHRHKKENDVLAYTFMYVKNNAKRREKVFTLTLEEFKSFCEASGYLEHKGKTKLSLSIDRIDNSRGYEADNIRAITLSHNSAKGAKGAKSDFDVPF